MSKGYRTGLAGLALAVLLLLCVSAFAEGIPEGYKKIAENTRFNLYLEESSLSLIAESKSGGGLLYSAVQKEHMSKASDDWAGFFNSGIVMKYIENVKSTSDQADFVNDAPVISVTLTGNGYIADVSFPQIGISYRVILEMDEYGFTVTVPRDEIVQQFSGPENDTRYNAASFYLYPFFGYSYMGGEEGYMIIPDGQGALIELEDHEGRYKSPFRKPVYGTNIGIDSLPVSEWSVDSERVIMPVYGIAHTEDEIAFLSVLEEGDAGAEIIAYPNGANNLSYDWACACVTYRMVYKQPADASSNSSTATDAIDMLTGTARSFDIVQRFLLTDGEDAGYDGLARAYGDYLERSGYLAGAVRRPFDIGIDLVGLEKENYILGRKDVVMTSFDRAGEILNELSDNGVRVSAVYRGWQKEGLTGGLPVTSCDPAGALGGMAGLKRLTEIAAGKTIPFSLEADFLTVNPDTHPTLRYSAFKRITGKTFTRETFGKVYGPNYYLTPSKTAQLAADVLDSMRKNGIPGVTLTGITSLVSDYYENGQYRDSVSLSTVYEKAAEDAGNGMSVTLSAPNQYLWRYASAMKDMPVSGSGYTYVSREIPFLAIALSGRIPCYSEYINFQANAKRFLLLLVEEGTRPCFLLTDADPIELQNTDSDRIYSSAYSLYRQEILSVWNELNALHALLGDARIASHTAEGDMTRVVWSNGVRVYINFGEKAGSMDGVQLDAMSWRAVTGE